MPKKVISEEQEPLKEVVVEQEEIKIDTKKVKNRGVQRVELDVNGKTLVILPKETVEVPLDFVIPTGVGLFEQIL